LAVDPENGERERVPNSDQDQRCCRGVLQLNCVGIEVHGARQRRRQPGAGEEFLHGLFPFGRVRYAGSERRIQELADGCAGTSSASR
jgi:hypothetical protein